MIARTLIAALALAVAGPAVAAAERLAPGVLVDVDAGRAIVADAAGYARAVSLADGASAWISGEPAFPLLGTPGRLLALGRIEARASVCCCCSILPTAACWIASRSMFPRTWWRA